MRKLLFLLPLIALLASCQSKREICAAVYAGEDMGSWASVARKLRLTPLGNERETMEKVWEYCRYLNRN
ncbi:MAG: lipoprotein [Synechococcus sp.]